MQGAKNQGARERFESKYNSQIQKKPKDRQRYVMH